MAQKRRTDPRDAALVRDVERLTDAEAELITRLLRGIEAALDLRERVRRGEVEAPVTHFDEVIETLRRDLELALRAGHGARPH